MFKNFSIASLTSPVVPFKIISSALFIDVKGVLNSCDTIDINSDFKRSSFSSFIFVSLISSYKIALSRGRETCFTRVVKHFVSSWAKSVSLKTSIIP